jgi:hypothetical protein
MLGTLVFEYKKKIIAIFTQLIPLPSNTNRLSIVFPAAPLATMSSAPNLLADESSVYRPSFVRLPFVMVAAIVRE